MWLPPQITSPHADNCPQRPHLRAGTGWDPHLSQAANRGPGGEERLRVFARKEERRMDKKEKTEGEETPHFLAKTESWGDPQRTAQSAWRGVEAASDTKQAES